MSRINYSSSVKRSAFKTVLLSVVLVLLVAVLGYAGYTYSSKAFVPGTKATAVETCSMVAENFSNPIAFHLANDKYLLVAGQSELKARKTVQSSVIAEYNGANPCKTFRVLGAKQVAIPLDYKEIYKSLVTEAFVPLSMSPRTSVTVKQALSESNKYSVEELRDLLLTRLRLRNNTYDVSESTQFSAFLSKLQYYYLQVSADPFPYRVSNNKKVVRKNVIYFDMTTIEKAIATVLSPKSADTTYYSPLTSGVVQQLGSSVVPMSGYSVPSEKTHMAYVIYRTVTGKDATVSVSLSSTEIETAAITNSALPALTFNITAIPEFAAELTSVTIYNADEQYLYAWATKTVNDGLYVVRLPRPNGTNKSLQAEYCSVTLKKAATTAEFRTNGKKSVTMIKPSIDIKAKDCMWATNFSRATPLHQAAKDTTISSAYLKEIDTYVFASLSTAYDSKSGNKQFILYDVAGDLRKPGAVAGTPVEVSGAFECNHTKNCVSIRLVNATAKNAGGVMRLPYLIQYNTQPDNMYQNSTGVQRLPASSKTSLSFGYIDVVPPKRNAKIAIIMPQYTPEASPSLIPEDSPTTVTLSSAITFCRKNGGTVIYGNSAIPSCNATVRVSGSKVVQCDVFQFMTSYCGQRKKVAQ